MIREEHEVALAELKKKSEEQESEVMMLRTLPSQLDEEKKKNAELSEQVSKMSEGLRAVEERIASAPEVVVKAYKQLDAFYRYLSV